MPCKFFYLGWKLGIIKTIKYKIHLQLQNFVIHFTFPNWPFFESFQKLFQSGLLHFAFSKKSKSSKYA